MIDTKATKSTELFRFRPKDRYLAEASLDKIYSLTSYWKSNMEFYSEELKFLKNLLSKYYIWLSKVDNLSTVKKVLKKITEIKNKQDELSDKTEKHLYKVDQLMKNAFNHDEEAFRISQGMLEEELLQFTEKYRSLKREVFSITENMIENDKLVILMSKNGQKVTI